MKKKISFGIPCYNSAETIPFVIDEIHKTMEAVSDRYDYEIITVVDGSPDNAFDVLKDIAITDKRVKVINFAKNYGQPNARMGTLKYATGDYVVCMDDDGQCPVNQIMKLIEPLENGSDITIADYPEKKQSWFKNFGSRFNTFTSRIVLDVPEDFRSSNFYAMKKFVRDQIVLYKNPYPFMDGLISQATKSIAYAPMEERERMSGTTGYTLKKLLGLWLNGFTAFSVIPLRIASLMGKFFVSDVPMGLSSTIACIMFVGGLIMLMLGMIGEYIGRIYISINNAPQFVERETINVKEED